jgi:hypothetical protein
MKRPNKVSEVTIEDIPDDPQAALDELEREAAVRRRCYDRWIADGKMSRTEGIDRYVRLMAAINILREHEWPQPVEVAHASPPPATTDDDKTPF